MTPDVAAALPQALAWRAATETQSAEAAGAQGVGTIIRGLATRLEISKPAVTRSLNHLLEFDLVRRMPDRSDQQSVLFGKIRAHNASVAMLRAVMSDTAQI